MGELSRKLSRTAAWEEHPRPQMPAAIRLHDYAATLKQFEVKP